ncbi:MAG TPA: hypothetical protein VL337_15035 [Acidimicrobiales bacterium]|nr:hypothetical protein [Acidimicrobiales bacterium]
MTRVAATPATIPQPPPPGRGATATARTPGGGALAGSGGVYSFSRIEERDTPRTKATTPTMRNSTEPKTSELKIL